MVARCWCVGEAPGPLCFCALCENGEPDGTEKQDVSHGRRRPCCECHEARRVQECQEARTTPREQLGEAQVEITRLKAEWHRLSLDYLELERERNIARDQCERWVVELEEAQARGRLLLGFVKKLAAQREGGIITAQYREEAKTLLAQLAEVEVPDDANRR